MEVGPGEVGAGSIIVGGQPSQAGVQSNPSENPGHQKVKLVYEVGGSKMVKNVPVPPDDRARFAITDEEILTLAQLGVRDRRPLQSLDRPAESDGWSHR